MGAVALRQMLAGLEGDLARLHSQKDPGAGYGALRDPGGVHAAFQMWHDGYAKLQGFHPITGPSLIVIHAMLATVFVAAYLGAGWRAGRMLELGPLPLRFLAAAGAVNVAANGLELLSALDSRLRGSAADILKWLFYLKWGLFLLAAFLALPGLFGAMRRAVSYLQDTSALARIALAASVAFLGLLNLGAIGSQSDDVLAGWIEGRWWHGVAALAAVAAYTAVVWLLLRVPPSGGRPARPWVLITAGLALAVVGYAVDQTAFGGSALLVLGGLLLVLGIGSTVVPTPPPQPAEASSHSALIVAGVLPPAAIALVQVRLLSSLIATHGPWPAAALVAAAALVVAFAVGLFLAGRAASPGSILVTRPWGALALFAPTVIAIGLSVVHRGALIAFGRAAGSMAVVVLGLVLVASLGGAFRVLFQGADAPAGLRALGFTRTPVVTLAVAAVLVSSSLDAARSDLHYHALPAVPEGARAAAPTPDCGIGAATRPGPAGEVGDDFCRWRDTVAKGRPGATVPLVLVTASGGGIRAAAWTARVLDCLLLPARPGAPDPCGTVRRGATGDRWRYVFAAGGASGGSVGIASTVAEEISGPDPTASGDWVRGHLGDDFLAPDLGYAVLGETPRGLVGLYTGDDRGAVLAQQWVRRWGTIASRCPNLQGTRIADAGFLTVGNDCPDVPLMLFNGTNVADGKRVNISPLDGAGVPAPESGVKGPDGKGVPKDTTFSPFSHDLRDVLCPGEDIRLFDAAFLSSRFPIVSPSGHLPPRPLQHQGCTRASTRHLDVVDGGYRDNSGASQIEELWKVVAPMVASHNKSPGGYATIRPILLQIDNGEGSSIPVVSTEGSGAQILRPVQTALHLLLDRGPEYTARLDDELQNYNDASTPKPLIYTLKLAEHPGSRLPLGWTLSHDALDSVDAQFTLDQTTMTASNFEAQFPS